MKTDKETAEDKETRRKRQALFFFLLVSLSPLLLVCIQGPIAEKGGSNVVIATDQLTTLDRVKATLGGVAQASTAQDVFLNLLIEMVSAEITASCNRTHWLLKNAVNPVTEVYCGTNELTLVLNATPVYTPWTAGDTVQGSSTISNVPSTAYLFPNQSVTGIAFQSLQPNVNQQPGPLYVTRVVDAHTVVVSAPAGATVTQGQVGFGLAVWANYYAYGGGVSGAWQTPTNMLAEGGTYWIDRDKGGGICHSGILGRIWGLWYGTWPTQHADLAPTQLPGAGNIQVQAAYGFERIPPNLEMACIWAVMKARMMPPFGQLLQSESDDGYSYSLAQIKPAAEGAVSLGILDGFIAPILAHYRIPAFGR